MDDLTIDCQGLHKRFDTATVGPIHFDVRPGEVFGLLGPDGVGKTTTMRMLLGILPPTSGEAKVLGFRVTDQSESIKREIGYMSQRFALYGDLTVAENISFYSDLFQVPLRERLERTRKLLEASRLTPFTSRQAQNLSGGMKQKLALVCALIHTPRLLLLDEPTTGVDPVSRRDFWQILNGLVRDGLTLVVSTPYMDEADRCHRIALMHQGRILLTDTPDEIRKKMHGVVLEVQGVSQEETRSILQNLDGVKSAESFGERVHIVVESADQIEPIRDALQRNHLPSDTLHQITPGLEDVFISLLMSGEDAKHAE